jgi:hypothetical protein
MISNGMPRMSSVWWIIAPGLPPSMRGTEDPRTANRWRASSSPAVNIRPNGTV